MARDHDHGARRNHGSPRVSRLAKAILFGGMHFCLQVAAYVAGFALGARATHPWVFGISLYDVAAVLTFPVVWTLEKLEWSGLGFGALAVNSLIWAAAFYALLWSLRRRRVDSAP